MMWEWLAGTKLGHAVIGLLACIVVGASLFGYGYYRGNDAGEASGAAKVAQLQTQIAEANVKATAAARAAENAQTDALTQVAVSYNRGKIDAQADAAAVTAGLRAGSLKLRDYWTNTGARSVPAAGSGAAGPDEAERRREESAGRAIGAAERCDNQVAGLQQVIRTYLRIINGSTADAAH